MRDDRDPRHPPRDEAEDAPEERAWDGGTFLTGLVIGAAVGAGLALLFAPASGDDTRRLIRKRARSLSRDAERGWSRARKRAGGILEEKKEALRDRLDQGLEAVEDQLGV